MRLVLAAVLLSAAAAVHASGDIRMRLSRRFPACRGTLEGAYAGDEWSFLDRVRFADGPLEGVLLLDKDRGERWVDLVSGGLSFSPSGDDGAVVLAGWLEATLGSGMVLAHPGAWSGSDPSTWSKPPSPRGRLRLASGSWSADGNGLTGVAGRFQVGGTAVELLQGVSWIDPSEGGCHRTAGELESKGTVREVLSALRVSGGGLGVTAAAGWERDGGSVDWQRAGADLQVRLGSLDISGEGAVGLLEGRASLAWKGSLSQDLSRWRHSLTVFGVPDSFPSGRSSPPAGVGPGPGLRYGFRWKALTGTTLSAGASAGFGGEGGLVLSAGVEHRFGSGAAGRLGFRRSDDGDGTGSRLLGAFTWEPGNDLSLTGRVQLTAWRSGDSSEAGGAVELRMRCPVTGWLRLGAGAAAFSTDGYDSRVYAAEIAFPGEFGSAVLYGRGFMLQAAVSVHLRESLDLRSRITWETKEDVDRMGSGWEETAGRERTCAGLQLDYGF